jgi:hypothetical protein
MDELFWGKDMEDVFDWIERLMMVGEVRELDEKHLFKIVKLNLKGEAQHCYHRLDLAPHDWAMLQALFHQKMTFMMKMN